jgi:BCD family chlorophyll transporter-like MFS transporter
VQASAGGFAIAAGGAIRDGVSHLATQGALGAALVSPVTGYSFVYHLEIYMLFAALIALGPLVRPMGRRPQVATTAKFGLADFPG